MTHGDRSAEVRRLFAAAMDRPVAERLAWLEAAGAEPDVHAEVAALLAALESGGRDVHDALRGLPEVRDLARQSGAFAGERIGRYELVEEVGRGGMGMVFRARDESLDRTVAVKLLTAASTGDEDARRRFEHEARAASGLDHPAACTVHEIGETADGRPYIVMEYIEGETLRELIRRGPLPLGDAIDIATRVAGALAAAHARGIVHRDVKPANVMVTPSGTVKLLDFGLARTADVRLTRTGTLLGTVTSMSPEQLRGGTIDRRTDVWALGVLLYEMIAGRPPFRGERMEAVARAILHDEPEPLTAVRSGLPIRLDDVIAKALAKDSADRYQHVDEIPVDLRALGAASAGAWSPGRRRLSGAVLRRAGVAAAGLVALAALLVTGPLRPDAGTPAAVRFTVPLESGTNLSSWYQPLAISASGRRIAFGARDDAGARIYLRDLDRLETVVVTGTEGGRDPFFSPDGRWLGFFADGALRRVALDEEADVVPQVICEVVQASRGASWGPDGTIVFTAGISSGLMRVPAGGGTPETITRPEAAEGEIGHLLPQHLPDGAGLLFTVWADDGWRTAVLPPGETRWDTVLRGGAAAHYAPTGHLIFAQMSTAVARPGLLAVAFDPERREVKGSPTSLLEEPGIAGPNFAFSDDGTLVYVAGGSPAWAGLDENRLVWHAPEAEIGSALARPGYFEGPRLSPDGTRIAVGGFSPQGTYDVWVHDLARGTKTRVTVEGSINNFPVWEPDGAHLTFNSSRRPAGLYRKAADGTGPAERLVDRQGHPQFAGSWSPDGRTLAYTQYDAAGRGDVWLFSVGRGPEPLLATSASERTPAFSPDGRWLAYVSDVSGRPDVYVRAMPGPGPTLPVSPNGGTQPVWAPGGDALFYATGDGILRANLPDGPARPPSPPSPAFEGRLAPSTFDQTNYDVSPTGRLLIVEPTEGSAPTYLNVVLNWFPRLEERLASAR